MTVAAPASPSAPAPPASPGGTSPTGNVLLVGRIVTLAQPPEVEALLIVDGRVAAIGSRADAEAIAPPGTKVIELGANVAYPGFIDAHAHWIGDREYYDVETPAGAMAAAAARGWTSISEQWADRDRLKELLALDAADGLPLRVDSYLALNGVHPGEMYGDWYADRQPGQVSDHLRVRGLKVHLDTGDGGTILWEPAELSAAIRRANAAGWQVSVHTVSTQAQAMVLDAFESAIGPAGPNPLRHRIEHALQVTDDQLARMAGMDLAIVVQLDGVAYDWVSWILDHGGERRDLVAEGPDLLGRWRDFIYAGLHVAGSSDAPWFFPDGLADDVGRAVDEIAGAMDERGRVYPGTPAWMLDQLLTAEQGLRAVTAEAAWALGDEKTRGHLAPGTFGDVTVLDGDVLVGTPDDVRALDVVATIVGGVAVYCAEPAFCP
jgi:predicted amidohydrolase YtcJ